MTATTPANEPRCLDPDGDCVAQCCPVHVDAYSDPAALTDEELAEVQASLDAHDGMIDSYYVRRLIAALRASRAEITQLKQALSFYAGSDDPKEGPRWIP